MKRDFGHDERKRNKLRYSANTTETTEKMNKTPKNDYFALSGDFDATIVIITVPNMAYTFKENTINNNGQEFKQF